MNTKGGRGMEVIKLSSYIVWVGGALLALFVQDQGPKWGQARLVINTNKTLTARNQMLLVEFQVHVTSDAQELPSNTKEMCDVSSYKCSLKINIEIVVVLCGVGQPTAIDVPQKYMTDYRQQNVVRYLKLIYVQQGILYVNTSIPVLFDKQYFHC